jgi:hypothetical protein
MKKVVILLVILLVIVAAGYAFHTYLAPWIKVIKTASTEAKQPYAMKEAVRYAENGPFEVRVELMNGAQWRVEGRRQSPGIVIGICDGTRTVSNVPGAPASRLDPRLELTEILFTASSYSGVSSLLPNSPSKTAVGEQVDGHACSKMKSIRNGLQMQLWIDRSAGTPVCRIVSGNGTYVESHYSRIPIDFTKPGTEEFFNTAHMAPFFTAYLAP